MSNDQAIAAVTLTIRSLLDREFNAPVMLPADPDLTGTRVSVRPPDRARDGISGNQINLFLYQTHINAALRNSDMPLQTRPGERSFPPLALDLLYLVTAYGSDSQDPDILAHRVLGRAISVLHDTPLLTQRQIREATAADLPQSDLHEQIEHVRITPQPISLEEISRLWSAFQTQYRVSTLFSIAVVLIESSRRTRAALPVLRRGEQDRGAEVLGDLVPPFPTLEQVRGTARRPGFLFGDTLALQGYHLDGANPVAVFASPRLETANELPALPGGGPTEVRVRLPQPPGDAPAPDDDAEAVERWPPGLYSVALRVERRSAGESAPRVRLSNALPLIIAPQIRLPDDPLRRDGDRLVVRVNCVPQVWPGQRAALLIGDREVPAGRVTAKTGAFEFDITGIAPGTHVLRLRVDGVDSVPAVEDGSPPRLGFADNQKVTIA